MEFSRQEYWSRLAFPSPGDLPNPVIEPGSPALQTDSLPLSYQGSPHVQKQLKNSEVLEQHTGSKSGKEYVKAVYCHPAYLTYMQSTS